MAGNAIKHSRDHSAYPSKTKRACGRAAFIVPENLDRGSKHDVNCFVRVKMSDAPAAAVPADPSFSDSNILLVWETIPCMVA